MSRAALWSVLFLIGATPILLSQAAPDSSKTPTAVNLPPLSDVAALTQALELYSQGNFAAALEKYRQLLLVHPKWPKIYAGLAQVYLRQGDVQQTDDIISKACNRMTLPPFASRWVKSTFARGRFLKRNRNGRK